MCDCDGRKDATDIFLRNEFAIPCHVIINRVNATFVVFINLTINGCKLDVHKIEWGAHT